MNKDKLTCECAQLIVDLTKENTALTEHLRLKEEELKQFEWVSVDDRLPVNERAEMNDYHSTCDVIVFNGDAHSAIFSCGKTFDFWAAFHVDGTDVTNSVTHWMPLPSAPQHKGEE